MDYRSSLAGFHNPYLHLGWSGDQFLREYVQMCREKGKKRSGWKHSRLADWIEANWDSQVKFVERIFPQTLKARGLNIS